MVIKSAVFKKGSPTVDGVFDDGLPHVAFIGRSNVGKSSTINALTKVKGLAKTSGTPGATKHINMFLVNNKFYIVDLPGYGYVSGSTGKRDALHDLIESYVFSDSKNEKKFVIIVDAKVGPSKDDLAMIESLASFGAEIVVAVNKIDKLKSTELKKQLQEIKNLVGAHTIVPYSAEKKTGLGLLLEAIS
jgi:GTP-binding protein